MRSSLTAFVFSLAAALLAVGNGEAAPELPAQSSTQAGVTVKAAPRSLSGGIWEFEVTLETHAGELSDDLTRSAVLIDAKGTKHRPVAWKGAAPGGHHRQGVLEFKAVSPRPQTIELRIDRPGEPKARSFRWQLK